MIRTILATAAASVALANCSSGGSGSSPPSSSQPGRSVAASALTSDLSKHIAELTGAHLAIDAGALGLTGSGDVQLRHGQPYSSAFTLDQGGDKVQVITAGGVSYAKLPAGQHLGDKPWVVVKDSSSNEFVRALSSTVTLLGAATSLSGISELLDSAATEVRDLGTEQVGGAPTEHYTMLIDPNHAKGPLGSELSAASDSPLPVDVWIRRDGFPAQVKIAVPLGSKTLPVLVKISNFFETVKIQAPPADQVSTD